MENKKKIGVNFPEDIRALALLAAKQENKDIHTFINDELLDCLKRDDIPDMPFLKSEEMKKRLIIKLNESVHTELKKKTNEFNIPMTKIVEKALYQKMISAKNSYVK